MDYVDITQDEDVVTRQSPLYTECIGLLDNASSTADMLIENLKPALLGEYYMSSEEVMQRLHISRRTLQNYRDDGMIPYTSIGGIYLYPWSKIHELLERNYCPVR